MKARKFVKIPIDEVTKTPTVGGTYKLIVNNYWAVTDDNCVLVLNNISNQCNPNQKIVELVVSKEEYPANRVLFIPQAWIKVYGF